MAPSIRWRAVREAKSLTALERDFSRLSEIRPTWNYGTTPTLALSPLLLVRLPAGLGYFSVNGQPLLRSKARENSEFCGVETKVNVVVGTEVGSKDSDAPFPAPL